MPKPILRPHISYRYAFKEVRLTNTKNVFVEKRPLCLDLYLDPDVQRWFQSTVLDTAPAPKPKPAGSRPDPRLRIHPAGLQDYF